MLGTCTLTALALFIAHNGANLDTDSLEAQLSPSDKAQVDAMVESENTLPGSLENLINETHDKIQRGEAVDPARVGQPCDQCLLAYPGESCDGM